MSSKRIKGITVEIGGDTTKLEKALESSNKTLSQTKSALKDVERLLKLDPGNTELLAQKQRLLAEAAQASADKLNILQEAAEGADAALQRGKDYAAKYEPLKAQLDQVTASLRGLENNAASMEKKLAAGEISTQAYDNFNRKLEETRKEQDSLRQSIRDLNKEFEVRLDTSQYDALQRELAASAIEARNAEEAARQGADGLDKMSEAAADLGDSAGGLQGGFDIAGGAIATFAGTAMTKLVDIALQALDALWNLDEATEEYRESMGMLNTAYETAGFSQETANEAYRGFFEILGETDRATEASQLLAQLATSGEDVAKWVDIAAGAYGTFGDSLPIEGLIEAANETAKTGEVTGVLADALNWVGISEEDVNQHLSQLGDETSRAQFLMGLLSNTYSDAADSFYENNEALIEARDAQADMDETLSVLGEAVSNVKTKFMDAFGPYIVDLVNAVADAIEFLTPLIDGIAFVVGVVIDAIKTLVGWIQKAVDWFLELIGVSSKGGNNLPVNGEAQVSGAKRMQEPMTGLYSTFANGILNAPGLAYGGLVPPGDPFLAVLGDNNREVEVVSPYSTIKRAVGEELDARGGGSGSRQGTATATLVLDGTRLGRAIFPYIEGESTRQGVRLTGGRRR